MKESIQSKQHQLFKDAGAFLNWWLEKPRLTGRSQRILKNYYCNYEGRFAGYLKWAWADRHFELDRELEFLKAKKELKLLDMGCGTGSVALYMACKIPENAAITGIDINKERLLCAQERKKVLEDELGRKLNCDIRESNLLSLSDDRKFDLIYLEEAFHHMEPRMQIVKKISDLLKDEGVLIISEVNAFNPFMQLLLYKNRGFNTIVKRLDENGNIYLYGNERVLPAKRITMMFRSHGVGIKSIRYFRLFASRLAGIGALNGNRLIALEKRFYKINFLIKIFSINYNVVLQK